MGASSDVAIPPSMADSSFAFRDPTDTEMTPQKVVIITIMTTSNVFMLLGNGFSIYIILCCRSLRKHTYYWLVLNLAVLDFMNSAFVVPINIVWEFYGYWPFSQLLCDIEIFCDLGFSIIAAYSTVSLSMDKYLYITKPFFYHTYVGSKTTLGSILATWVIWLTYSAASVFGELARSTKEYKYNFPLDNCHFVLRHAYAITSFILIFFLPLVILVFTSSRILYVARQHIKQIHTNHCMSDAVTSSQDFSVYSPTTIRNSSVQTSTVRDTSTDTPEPFPSGQKPAACNNHLDVTSAAGPPQTSSLTATTSATPTDSEEFSTVNADGKNSSTKHGSVGKTATPNAYRALGTVTLVVMAYIIMFAPYWIASVINLGCVCIEPLIFEDYLAVFYYMHSLVNPYIYMATDRRYKKAIRHMIGKSKWCQRFKGGSVRPNIHISSTNL